jgi:rRNA maturation endonuclease Nob1
LTELEGWVGVTFYGILFLLGLLFYFLARKSRKNYRCPECGESFRVEHMSVSRCKVCGTEVEATKDDTSDKI